MVLSILSLTTTPSRIRFGIYCSLTGGLLAQHRLDAGDVAAHLAHAACLAELSAGLLEAQVESFLAQVAQLFLELVVGLGTQIGGLHGLLPQPSAPTRATKRVLIGSLAAASSSASRATWIDTPSSSNSTRPGLTRAAQNSGAPLPEPMRTSAGFFDTGTSGNTRIHTRPARFMWRVMALRGGFLGALVVRHRVVRHDLALEYPDLDAAGAEGGEGGGDAVVDVGAQRVQRHAALAVPFHAGDFSAAQAARAVDADALGAQAHRRLHGALHGA